jgi:hypothetical protein
MTELDRLAWTAALLGAFEERGLELPEPRWLERVFPTMAVDHGSKSFHMWHNDSEADNISFGVGVIRIQDSDNACESYSNWSEELTIAEAAAWIANHFKKKAHHAKRT